MITCQHARQLFDRYLDGELSPSLQAELHAHQLSCSACQTELAMLEACGDVIMLDRRREPTLSDSFTDRVLMARRAQLVKQPRRRSWGRTLVLVSSPLAAAASIVLAMSLMWPSAPQRPTVVSGQAFETSPANKTLLGGSPTGETAENLPTPPIPSSSMMELLLASVVEQTSKTVDGTKSSLAQFGMLLQQALAEANAQLVAQENGSLPKTPSSDRPAEHQGGEDLQAPGPSGLDSSGESGGEALLDPV